LIHALSGAQFDRERIDRQGLLNVSAAQFRRIYPLLPDRTLRAIRTRRSARKCLRAPPAHVIGRTERTPCVRRHHVSAARTELRDMGKFPRFSVAAGQSDSSASARIRTVRDRFRPSAAAGGGGADLTLRIEHTRAGRPFGQLDPPLEMIQPAVFALRISSCSGARGGKEPRRERIVAKQIVIFRRS